MTDRSLRSVQGLCRQNRNKQGPSSLRPICIFVGPALTQGALGEESTVTPSGEPRKSFLEQWCSLPPNPVITHPAYTFCKSASLVAPGQPNSHSRESKRKSWHRCSRGYRGSRVVTLSSRVHSAPHWALGITKLDLEPTFFLKFSF